MTQAAWRAKNGFGAPGNETVVVAGHKNISDLGFFRRIEMVIDKRPGFVGNVAMTTFNYLCEDDAVNNTNPLSIVNMEYSPGPNGNRITKFYIYDAAGNRKTSVKKLNQGVVMTKANVAVQSLLSGLYGGSRLPNPSPPNSRSRLARSSSRCQWATYPIRIYCRHRIGDKKRPVAGYIPYRNKYRDQ